MHNVVPNAKAYIAAFQSRLLRCGGTILCAASAEQLVQQGSRTTGVVARLENRDQTFRARCGVVLAAGDYSNASDMIARHRGDEFAVVEGINPHATGDGHRLADQVGARMLNMEVTYGPEFRFVAPPHDAFAQLLPSKGLGMKLMGMAMPLVPRSVIHWMIKRLLVTWQHPEDSILTDGAILLNRDGRRFCNEVASPDREIAVACQPEKMAYPLPKLRGHLFQRPEVPVDMNHTPAEPSLDRRTVMKNLISLPVIGGFAFAVAKTHGWKSFEEAGLERVVDGVSAPTIVVKDAVDLAQLRKSIPRGRLGDLELGRIICGGNLISGFAHSRDLIYVSQFLKNYFTEKKVMDTFWLCEQCGINATAVSVRPEPIKFLKRYWKNGGAMKWIAPTAPKEEDYRANIDLAIDNGASAALIMGNVGDAWARAGKFELMAEVIDYIKSQGVLAGLAGHELATIQGAEEHNVGAEFYMKTLHSRDYWSWRPEQEKAKMIIDNYAVDNYWERTPEETIAFMEGLDKPWIAFKTLAAGAVHPKMGFRYAFENGADFICVGRHVQCPPLHAVKIIQHDPPCPVLGRRITGRPRAVDDVRIVADQHVESPQFDSPHNRQSL